MGRRLAGSGDRQVRPGTTASLLEKAAASGLRSLFVGFESVNAANLHDQRKYQNIGPRL